MSNATQPKRLSQTFLFFFLKNFSVFITNFLARVLIVVDIFTFFFFLLLLRKFKAAASYLISFYLVIYSYFCLPKKNFSFPFFLFALINVYSTENIVLSINAVINVTIYHNRNSGNSSNSGNSAQQQQRQYQQ